MLQHRDLDEVAAQELIDQKVKAVINCELTMSGRYPTHGPLMLLQEQIPIWEADAAAFEAFRTNAEITVYEDRILLEDQEISCSPFTREKWLSMQQQANERTTQLMEHFIDNTLTYAMREMHAVMDPLPHIALKRIWKTGTC